MRDQPFTIALEPDDERALAAQIHDKLGEFNFNIAGHDDRRPLVIVARNVGGELIGGLLGDLFWQALAVHILWVAAEQRGQGIGAALLARAEAEARAAGCLFAQVDTMEFQAPDFYVKFGYEVFGTVGPYVGKYTRYYLKKVL